MKKRKTHDNLASQLVGTLAVGINLAFIAGASTLPLGSNTGVVLAADKTFNTIAIQLAVLVERSLRVLPNIVLA